MFVRKYWVWLLPGVLLLALLELEWARHLHRRGLWEVPNARAV